MIEFCLSRLLLLLLFSCIGLGAGWSDTGRGGGGGGGGRPGSQGKTVPSFGDTPSTIRVKVGQTAKLPCLVYHLSDKEVTWLRRRDLHILTTGHHTYSADDRFQIAHSPGADEWTLVVRFAQVRDSGVYECQVNADPKLSRPVSLDVLDTTTPKMTVTKSKTFVANNTASTRDGHLKVRIEGPPELYIEEGSTLTLTCLVTSTYGPSTLVYWYHDTRMLDYNSHRGGIKLKIDHKRGETAARLVVSGVAMHDSGMYSCVPAGSHPASVRVHVHQGKQEAAIQQSGLNITSASHSIHTAILPASISAYYLIFSILSLSHSYGLAGIMATGMLLLPYSSLLLLLLLPLVFLCSSFFSSYFVSLVQLCLGKGRRGFSCWSFVSNSQDSFFFPLCSFVCNYGRRTLCFALLLYASFSSSSFLSSSLFLYKYFRCCVFSVLQAFIPPPLSPPLPPLLLLLLCSLFLSSSLLLSVAA